MSGLSHLVRRHGLDLLVVLAALQGAVAALVRDDEPGADRLAPALAATAVALVVLPLLVRRRLAFGGPAAVWVLAPALSFVDGRLVVATFGVYAAGLVAAGLLGNLRDVGQGRIGLALVVVGAAIIVRNNPRSGADDVVFVPAVFVIAWLAGYALRARAAEVEAAEERAAHAERERESAARVAVAEERARIARELHDIVAHAVSVMVLHVGAVRHRLPETLAEEEHALRGVESTGRAALGEMRRLLGALHDGEGDVALAPQPGLDDLDALAEKVRQAGLPVRLHIEGEARPLPSAVDLSAYRIVQEGLTNSLKHARATHADVTVRYAPDGLRLQVRDDGVGAAPGDGLGHGLVGVRERVKIYGGDMTAGAAPDGGFVLRAHLPLDGRP